MSLSNLDNYLSLGSATRQGRLYSGPAASDAARAHARIQEQARVGEASAPSVGGGELLAGEGGADPESVGGILRADSFAVLRPQCGQQRRFLDLSGYRWQRHAKKAVVEVRESSASPIDE